MQQIEINLNYTQTLNLNSTQIDQKSNPGIECVTVTDTWIQVWELGTWNPEASRKTLPKNTILLLVHCWINHVLRIKWRRVLDLRVLGKFVVSSEKRNPESKYLEMKSKQLNKNPDRRALAEKWGINAHELESENREWRGHRVWEVRSEVGTWKWEWNGWGGRVV